MGASDGGRILPELRFVPSVICGLHGERRPQAPTEKSSPALSLRPSQPGRRILRNPFIADGGTAPNWALENTVIMAFSARCVVS